MSGVQMFLVIGAIALFSILVININNSVINSEEQQIYAEYVSIATKTAQDVLEEVGSKNFDEGTIGLPEYNVDLITSPGSLGFESGETLNSYDDIDDYNNHTRTVSTARGGDFSILVKVNYVNENNFNTDINSKSRSKKIDVAVFNQYLADTLHLNYFKSY